MPTSLKEELLAQARWRLKGGQDKAQAFAALLRNEFLSDDEQHARQAAALRRVLRFASAQVPYYRHLLRRQGISAEELNSIDDLRGLPVLTRADVQQYTAQLRPMQLPPGQRLGGAHRTSGTTGQPVEVFHTHASFLMSHFQKQRELRWFRFDPQGMFAQIRPAKDVPRGGQPSPPSPGQTIRLATWPMVGSYFQTGPFLGLSDMTDIEDQVDWIERHRPNYILAQSAKLEHVALAFQDRPAPAGLRGLLAISQQLTAEMRRRIEGSLGVRVDQNYGLNEIGIVASRCPEGQRYHVHAEHCLVEIVDARGKPCAPGQRGRLLVTGLNNPAMPLLRYDTDDMAEAAHGPCPCGRTLPSFAGLHGRYRRTIALPAGTWEYWDALLKALEEMPREFSRDLRQYQLHQYRSGEFKLRIVAASPLPAGFLERIHRGWAGGARGPVVPLEILQVDRIENAPGAKFQNFVSDFF